VDNFELEIGVGNELDDGGNNTTKHKKNNQTN
jgi:hypothetical protein